MAQASDNDTVLTSVPNGRLVSVEHPCVIKHDVEKAMSMLGGSNAISQVIRDDSTSTFALSFHPEDPAARTIVANQKQAGNVLLQISLPRRTGRKRKRGSKDDWIVDDQPAGTRDCAYFFRSLQDNHNHTVKPLGSVSNMHIWRSMPDFAYSTQKLDLLEEVKSKLLSQQYPAIRDFELPLTHGLEDTTSLPPVVWSQQSIPNNYTYRQNPSVKVLEDPTTGRQTLQNTQAAPRIFSYQMQWDSEEYPSSPDPKCPPLEQQSAIFIQTVNSLKQLFEERPLWSRRALLNSLTTELSSFNVVRFCLAYVSYALRSGPWRDTYCRLGTDPRKDPIYRVYQTIMLQLVPKESLVPTSKFRNRNADQVAADNNDAVTDIRAQRHDTRETYARQWTMSKAKQSHIFDGTSSVPPDGKIWQLCDITAAPLAHLRDLPVDEIRSTCETRYYGWYYGGTVAKLRVGLKAMVDALQQGDQPNMQALDMFFLLPEQVESGVSYGLRKPEVSAQTASTDDTETIIDTTVQAGDQISAPMDTSADAAEQPDKSDNTNVAKKVKVRKTAPAPVGSALTSDELVRYVGEQPTRQLLDWVGLYRQYAKLDQARKPSDGSNLNSRGARPSTDAIEIAEQDEEEEYDLLDGEEFAIPTIEGVDYADEEVDTVMGDMNVKLEDQGEQWPDDNVRNAHEESHTAAINEFQ